MEPAHIIWAEFGCQEAKDLSHAFEATVVACSIRALCFLSIGIIKEPGQNR